MAGKLRLLCAAPLFAFLLAGCGLNPFFNLSPRDCMARVMYFESNRSSEDGMLAVGTVVENRIADREYPRSVCGVVGQPNQFAPGALWKPMKDKKSAARAYRVADYVLRGGRHPSLSRAVKHFHTAGLSFPYNNMYYVLEAGGNAFYEKRKPGTF